VLVDDIYPDGVKRIDSVDVEHLLTKGVAVEQKLILKENVETGEADEVKLTRDVILAFIEVDNFAELERKGLAEGVSVPPLSPSITPPPPENVACADEDCVVLPDDVSLGVPELELDRVEVADTNALLLLVTVPTDERVIPNNDVLA